MTLRGVPLAWLQLRKERLRLLAALSGVAFAVILIFVQLGFQEALFESAVQYHTALGYDLAMISPKTDFIVEVESFPRARLHQVRGIPGVEGVSPVLLGRARWRHPLSPEETRSIFVVGFDPADEAFDLPGLGDQRSQVQLPDRMLFDRLSRPEFGPIPELLARDGSVSLEVNNRGIQVVGLFEVGPSFGIDGSLLTSNLNFRRIFPDRPASNIGLGLIRLVEGADPASMRKEIVAAIPADVLVLTRAAFVDREVSYWNSSTPIGYVFSFGVVMGLVVGAVIVYQILFSDVQEHLKEYATLKAMGYTHRYLVGVVLQEAIILALLGFVPGFLLTLLIYSQAGDATRLPIEMTLSRALIVLSLTISMCAVSGAIAIRKLRAADPAEVF